MLLEMLDELNFVLDDLTDDDELTDDTTDFFTLSDTFDEEVSETLF